LRCVSCRCHCLSENLALLRSGSDGHVTPKRVLHSNEEERAAALALWRDPNLFGRILADFERCGVVGEETNKKVSYRAVVSRLLPAPLAPVVQSSSAAGKSSLMEAVLDFLPEEQRLQFSAMTGQSLDVLLRLRRARQRARADRSHRHRHRHLRLRCLRQSDPLDRLNTERVPLRRRTVRPRPESLLQPRSVSEYFHRTVLEHGLR
jgi:hypothetical protein